MPDNHTAIDDVVCPACEKSIQPNQQPSRTLRVWTCAHCAAEFYQSASCEQITTTILTPPPEPPPS